MKKLKRSFYILKCRAYILFRHLAEKILLKLSEWDLIYCHRVGCSSNTDDGVVHTAPDITSDRFIFSVSYIFRKLESKYEYWFETKKGKRIFTVEDSHHLEHRISYRANLKAFFAHFSPRQRMWVDYVSPVVQLFEESYSYAFPDLRDETHIRGELKVNTHRCDFSQCRYAFDFCYAPESLTTCRTSDEVFSESYRALEVQLTSKVTEINKILTGVNYDGEMMSPKNMPMSENILCRHCGLPVFASAENKYNFECLSHGELDFGQVRRVDPVEYKKVLEYTFDTLEALIHKSCPQDSNL